jgi:hypothetical protein
MRAKANRGHAAYRHPTTLTEAEAMIAYNQRQIAESGSAQIVDRAARMITNLQPHLERLAAQQTAEVALRARRECDDYEVVWDGVGPLPGFEDRPGFGFRIDK